MKVFKVIWALSENNAAFWLVFLKMISVHKRKFAARKLFLENIQKIEMFFGL